MDNSPTIPISSTSYWLHWTRLNWITKTAAALRRKLAVRGRRGGGALRRLAQAASAFMLAASMLLGQAPRPALAATPAFVLSSSTAPFGLTDIGSYVIPALVDIDGDGDLDAFVGEDAGNLNFFRNTGSAIAPAFTLATSAAPFGLSDMDTAAAAPAFVDTLRDGDLDAVIGERDGNVNFFSNTGNATAPAFGSPSSLDAGAYSVPAFADIDGDGDPDLFVGQQNGNLIFYRMVNGAWTGGTSTNPFGLSSIGNFRTPSFIDIDDDGDLDTFTGQSSGSLLFYRNTGTATAPAFESPSTNVFGLANVGNFSAPAFGDIDGDGDYDAVVGKQNGEVHFFFNAGNARTPSFSYLAASTFVNGYSAPYFSDIDGDGDLDLMLGQQNGNFQLQVNTGHKNFPVLVTASSLNPFGLAGIGEYSAPVFVDINADGRLDLFSGHNDGNLYFFRGGPLIFLPLVLRS